MTIALICTLLLAMLMLPSSLAARGMWGSRRKRGDDEDQDSVSAGLGSGFEARNTMASISRKMAGAEVGNFGDSIPTNGGNRMGRGNAGTLGAGAGALANGALGETVASLLSTYLTMMEELVNSPDFETMVTPETMKTMFAKLPGLSDSPEISAMLDSPQFTDPTLLKQTVMQGLEAIKMYSSNIVEMVNNPEQLMQMLDQLPAEAKSAVEGLLQGDMSGLKNMLSTIPGIDDSQRGMLMNLLDGNVQGMASQAKNMLQNFDSSQTEAARQQFLANPAMAEMLGLTEDVLNDKDQFDALMAQGMEALMAAADGTTDAAADGNDDSEIGGNSRLFKGASMAA